jgi:hypothetical protein
MSADEVEGGLEQIFIYLLPRLQIYQEQGEIRILCRRPGLVDRLAVP